MAQQETLGIPVGTNFDPDLTSKVSPDIILATVPVPNFDGPCPHEFGRASALRPSEPGAPALQRSQADQPVLAHDHQFMFDRIVDCLEIEYGSRGEIGK